MSDYPILCLTTHTMSDYPTLIMSDYPTLTMSDYPTQLYTLDITQLTLEGARGWGGVVVGGIGATRCLWGVGPHRAGCVRLVPGGGRVRGGGKVRWGCRVLIAVVKVIHSGNQTEKTVMMMSS